jgi:hypothetical protein
MPIDDPAAWAQGAAAFKGIFDGLRTAIGVVRDVHNSGKPSSAEQTLVDEALDQAEKAAKIAEAQVAKALGYELCKCEFPPVPMLTVGHIDNAHAKLWGAVYECPRCGYNSARVWSYTRIAPPREARPPAETS